jgi:tripartite-type tricarboxylate transporter receptor subunit TctC
LRLPPSGSAGAPAWGFLRPVRLQARRLRYVAAAVFALSVTAPAHAQRDADAAYPSRVIRLITPFSAGSTLDVMARLVAERLTGALAHNVVVDNRPGANGVIGIDLVAKAPPDGYTMLLTTGSFTGNVVLYKKLPYDGVRDFAPVTCA